MKIILPFVVLMGTFFSAQALAECTTGRNADINITKPDNIYTDHRDGTVTDKETGLMWQKCSLGLSGADCTTGTAVTHTWQAALAAANTNTGNGYSDWRLPNKNELASLTEKACINPAINETVFPATVSKLYWSSALYSDISYFAWVVHFYYGDVNNDFKLNSYSVRLVRGSQ